MGFEKLTITRELFQPLCTYSFPESHSRNDHFAVNLVSHYLFPEDPRSLLVSISSTGTHITVFHENSNVKLRNGLCNKRVIAGKPISVKKRSSKQVHLVKDVLLRTTFLSDCSVFQHVCQSGYPGVGFFSERRSFEKMVIWSYVFFFRLLGLQGYGNSQCHSQINAYMVKSRFNHYIVITHCSCLTT